MQQIIPAIRERFGKHPQILVRADSGFCREELMSWIEAQANMSYVFGLARNPRLEAQLAPAFWRSAALLDEDAVLCARSAGATAPPVLPGTARSFAELRYRTLKELELRAPRHRQS